MFEPSDFRSANGIIQISSYASFAGVINILGCVNCTSTPFGGTFTTSVDRKTYKFFIPSEYKVMGGKLISRVNGIEVDNTICDLALVGKPTQITATLNGKDVSSFLATPYNPDQTLTSEVFEAPLPSINIISGENELVYFANTSCPTLDTAMAGHVMPTIILYVVFGGNI